MRLTVLKSLRLAGAFILLASPNALGVTIRAPLRVRQLAAGPSDQAAPSHTEVSLLQESFFGRPPKRSGSPPKHPTDMPWAEWAERTFGLPEETSPLETETPSAEQVDSSRSRELEADVDVSASSTKRVLKKVPPPRPPSGEQDEPLPGPRKRVPLTERRYGFSPLGPSSIDQPSAGMEGPTDQDQPGLSRETWSRRAVKQPSRRGNGSAPQGEGFRREEDGGQKAQSEESDEDEGPPSWKPPSPEEYQRLVREGKWRGRPE